MAKKKAVEGSEPKAPETVLAVKAFRPNFTCRGYQFEVGKTYTHEGEVKMCESGFHACVNPLDVLRYYDLIADDGNLSRFASVELSGHIERHSEDSKVAAASIHIKAELKLPEFITRAVNWIIESCKVDGKDERVQSASGDSSQLAASGHSSQLAASGHSSRLAASGHSSRLAASGHSSQLAASGDSSRLAASGHSSQLAASGHYSQLAASGDSSRLAASGHYSQLAASGDSSRLAASGDSSRLAASGDSSQLAASGHSSVIASSSIRGIAKGVDGTWIALAEYDSHNRCVGFATGCIGQDGLVADTWYRAQGGKLVPA